MKRILLTILAITLCLMAFSGCENSDVKFNDFSDYKNDFEAIVDYVSDFSPHTINTIISSYTIDFYKGYIEIDSEHQSPESLNPSIKRVFDKGFTFIEVNADCMIFWYDNMSYGVLWTNAPVESLSRIRDELGSYQTLTDGWYEVGNLIN